MSWHPWRATIYFVADTDGMSDLALDEYADAITKHLERIKEIGGRPVMLMKVPELEVVSEQEFDDA